MGRKLARTPREGKKDPKVKIMELKRKNKAQREQLRRQQARLTRHEAKISA